MSKIKSKNTTCELLVRKSLRTLGFKYRLHARSLPGKPDIVVSGSKIAIQVRGCFWHGHTCSDGRKPGTNKNYWGPKLLGNMKRDRRNDAKLRRLGWSVFTIWECHAHAPKKLKQKIDHIKKQFDVQTRQ